jgi:ABC-type transport system involved in cytochrome c biogenesis permease component
MELTMNGKTDTILETRRTAGRKGLWAGRIMSGLMALFLLFDAAGKLLRLQPVVEGTAKLGFPTGVIVPLGVVLLTCVVLYLIPRTALLGAVLLTGYLGGAIATHVRAADPLFSHTLFPIYVGALIWGGLYLRDARVRALIAPRPRA